MLLQWTLKVLGEIALLFQVKLLFCRSAQCKDKGVWQRLKALWWIKLSNMGQMGFVT